jgi:hypothetical protein
VVQSDRKGQGSEDRRGGSMRARHWRTVLQSRIRTRGKKSLIEKAIGPADLILLTWMPRAGAHLFSKNKEMCDVCGTHPVLGAAPVPAIHMFLCCIVPVLLVSIRVPNNPELSFP